MDSGVKLPEFYFGYQVNFLKFLGIDVLNKEESRFYKVYSFLTILFTVIYIFVECIEVAFHRDFDMMVVCCNYSISHFLGGIKMVVMYRNRKQFGDLLRSLHEGVFKPSYERGGIFEKKCILKVISEAFILNFTYGMSIVGVISLAVSSAVQIRLTEPQEMWRLSFLPISIVETLKTPHYEIAFFYQLTGIIYISLYVWTIDVTVVSVIAQIGAQVKILERSLRDYENRGARRYALTKTGTLHDSISNELEEAIDHHLQILDKVDLVEYLCSYLVLCVFIANLVLLCILMYYTSLMERKSLEFLQYLVYCFLIAIQVFLYCWFGNELTLANEDLSVAAAQTYNVDQPVSYAKALKMVLIRSQRPLFLTAGKFTPLSLETYKGLIKGSFSYFMVLRHVNEK